MGEFRDVEVSDRARGVAEGYGWPKEDVERRLKQIAKRSAPATHKRGNRRFDHYILSIKDGVLLDIYDIRFQVHDL